VQATPDDVPLRLHLAELLLDVGKVEEAVTHVAAALQREPNSIDARALMGRAMAGQAGPPVPAVSRQGMHRDEPTDRYTFNFKFNWEEAESQFADVTQPWRIDPGTKPLVVKPPYEVELATVRLSDIAGMAEVKRRLDSTFLAPLRNPDLRRKYGPSLRSGLLLYGPPGCGKTLLARAIAGEIGARFLAISLSELLDRWPGSAERNLHLVFAAARRAAPCVLFIDELDALDRKRSRSSGAGSARAVLNQLLGEMDGTQQNNEGLSVLAAAEAPWEILPTMFAAGRFDRTLLVLPPDALAREAVLRQHLRDRPVSGVLAGELAKRTKDYSSADLALLCENAAERALRDSARNGKTRMIDIRDFEAALAAVRPSVGAWLTMARNGPKPAGVDAGYEELQHYLKLRGLA
jgi:SpoVK/Ycf46/Vps4 family AAA+-type ATPase